MKERKVPSMKTVGPATAVVFALLGFSLAFLLRRQNLFSVFGGAGVGVAALGALVAFILAGGLYLVWAPVRQATEQVALKMVRHVLKTEGWTGVILGILLTPVGEEILFRGGLQGSLGLVMTSLLFGLSHGGWRRDTWGYAVVAALIGLVLGEVYILTGSLTASILAHVAYNLAVTVLLARGWWPFRPTAAEAGEQA